MLLDTYFPFILFDTKKKREKTLLFALARIFTFSEFEGWETDGTNIASSEIQDREEDSTCKFIFDFFLLLFFLFFRWFPCPLNTKYLPLLYGIVDLVRDVVVYLRPENSCRYKFFGETFRLGM